MNLAFEQLPKESAKAFAAFSLYLNLGAERSLAAVAQKLSKSEQLLKRWSAKYDWQARVKNHGAHLAEVERKAIEGATIENAVDWHRTHEAVRREAWQEAEKTIAMVRQARALWEKSGRTPGWEGMARMLELAFKLKQFAAGMPNEVKEVNTNITATVDVSWEIEIRKAYGLAAPPASEPALMVESILDAEIVAAKEIKP